MTDTPNVCPTCGAQVTAAGDGVTYFVPAFDARPVVERLLGLLLDVWLQYGIEIRDVPNGYIVERWAGGMSGLEDIYAELRAAGMIDENGLEQSP